MREADMELRGARRGLNLKYLLVVTLILAALMIATSLLVIRRARISMFKVLEKEGFALLESLVLSSQNTLKANDMVEGLITERLSEIGRMIKLMGDVEDRDLSIIAGESGLKRIDIFDGQGRPIRSSSPRRLEPEEIPVLQPILEGEAKQMVVRTEKDDYGVALSRGDGLGAVVCYLDGSYLKSFKQEIGIGYLIQSMSKEKGIEYVLLQSEEGILFASKNIEKMRRIEKDSFLKSSLSGNAPASRVSSFENRDILEVVKPFYLDEEPLGIFRLGLSLAGYREVLRDTRRHTLVLSGIFFLLAVIALNLIIINQNYSLLRRSYQEMRFFTDSLLGGIESGVVAVDPSGRLRIFNRAAEEIFSVSGKKALGLPYSDLFPADELLLGKVADKGRTGEVELTHHTASGERRTLIVAASTVYNEDGEAQGAVSLVRDVTHLKLMQEKMRQKERLSALGDLAAGVGHEIRNPLNAISLSVQRLEEEFSPEEAGTEFSSLTKGIREEVRRLDEIVRQFLSLAKPPKLNLGVYEVSQVFEELLSLVREEARARGVEIETNIADSSEVELDVDYMKRALLNLLKNSLEAMAQGGKLTVSAWAEEGQLNIEIADTGTGITEESLSKVWEPYFSTKKDGTGLGLSLVHKIVTDHGGTIEVQSEPGAGTTFTITLPVKQSGSG